MNEQLKTIVNEYRDYYYQFADRSDDYALEEREKMINYMTEAAKVAYLSENAPEYGYEITTEIKKWINKIIWDKSGCEFWVLEHWAQDNKAQLNLITRGFEIYYLEAPYRFESYCFYMEKNRRYDKRFYVPRRKTLKVVTDDIQDLEDDKIDFYGLSQASRTGKSTMGIFGLSWVGLRKPDSHSAMGGHSGQLAKRFFKGYSNLVETSEYTFSELFTRLHPDLPVLESKSSDPAEFTINLGNKDEFATMSCRGIDGTWTGAIDVSSDGYLYVDDLIRDREHSMSASREENTYQEYQNKMLDRMNDGAKEIMIGTLWNVGDPLERERRQFEDNPRYRFRRIPALNDNDESNFQYEVKGFSTEYYKKMRDRLDKAEWMAKFQQQPFVREGLVFPIEELKTGFRGVLPDGMFTVVAVCDPAFGGGDRLSMPICATFKDREEKYIIDWVHDKRTPGYTVPRIVDKIAQHYITRLRIEKNSGGQLMADNIKKELDARGIHHCKIEMVSAKVRLSKEDKISGYSDYAKRYFNFMLPGKWTESVDKTSAYIPGEQYRLAMDELVTYSPEGMGKQHDDSADAIAQLAIMFEESISNKVEAVINPFRRKQIHGGR